MTDRDIKREVKREVIFLCFVLFSFLWLFFSIWLFLDWFDLMMSDLIIDCLFKKSLSRKILICKGNFDVWKYFFFYSEVPAPTKKTDSAIMDEARKMAAKCKIVVEKTVREAAEAAAVVVVVEKDRVLHRGKIFFNYFN